MATSNLGDIEAALMELARCCELDRPGPNGGPTLADELFDVDVRGILRRSIQEQHGPAAELWPPNAPAYAARKGGLPIGVLTGEMLSPVELEGTRLVESPDRAEMHYGATGFAQAKALWFEEGTTRGQPPRPFYDSNESDNPEKEAIVLQQIVKTIERLGG